MLLNRSWIIPLLLILCFPAYSQEKPVNCSGCLPKIFDSNLTEVKMDAGVPVVIVSNKNCGSCVNYFLNHRKKYRYLFILSSESLLEIQKTLKVYKLKKEDTYFTTCESVKQVNESVCEKPTPCLLMSKGGTWYFYDYTALDTLTSEFTAKQAKFRKTIN